MNWQKSMCLAAGTVCQSLACVLAVMLLRKNIKPNGTAVKIRLRYPAKLSGQCLVSLAWDLSR